MRSLVAIVALDVRGICRDHVAVATLLLSFVGTAAITLLGTMQDRLPGWAEWFPLMVAVSLVGSPGGFGLLFGLLMVDEGDTGVRSALAVSPVKPVVFLVTRTVVATTWVLVWPLASVYLMNWTWQVIDLPLAHWLAVVLPLALFTPALALVIPTLADDKVGALAVFKGLSFLMLIPLALYVAPGQAWYRPFFLLSPAAWVMEAYLDFLDGHAASGYWWASGGAAYAVVLFAVVAFAYVRNVYQLRR